MKNWNPTPSVCLAIFKWSLCCAICLLCQPGLGQYANKTPEQILREAQERQRALDKTRDDAIKGFQDILDQQQQRRQEERDRELERRRQEREDRSLSKEDRQEREAERRAGETARQQAEFQRDVQETVRRQQESFQCDQEAIQRTLNSGRQNRPAQSAPSRESSPPLRPAGERFSGGSPSATTPNSTQGRRSGNSDSRRDAKPKPTVTAQDLPGSPNESSPPKKDWSAWQPLSDHIWVSYCKVLKGGSKSKPLWTWSLKNWSDREMKGISFEYWEDGKWHFDLVPMRLKPKAAHGGWGSFTASGQESPQIRIIKVEFK